MKHDAIAREAGTPATAARSGASSARTWGRHIDCTDDKVAAPRETRGRGAGERLEGDDRETAGDPVRHPDA